MSLICQGNISGLCKHFKHYTLSLQPPPPPNTADLGTDEKAAVFGNRRYWELYITYKTLIWDLEMGGGIGGGGWVTVHTSKKYAQINSSICPVK